MPLPLKKKKLRKKERNSLVSKAKENIKCIHHESKKIVLTFIHQSGSLVLAENVKFQGLCSLSVHLSQTTSI